MVVGKHHRSFLVFAGPVQQDAALNIFVYCSSEKIGEGLPQQFMKMIKF